jgi:uridine kinase
VTDADTIAASLAPTAALLAERIRSELTTRRPLVVALDGRSGSGKSTLASTVRDRLAPSIDVVVIDGDGFYAGGSAATWDRRDAAEKADGVIDWRRQRRVLGSLRTDGVAQWQTFDWDAEDWDADDVPLAPEPERATLVDVAILDGAYSARPELADLVDLRVLLDVPDDVRLAQLIGREGDEYQADWSARWGEAELHYFGTVMPPAAFDLVIRP